LQDVLDSYQIAEWIEFAKLEPFGSRVEDFRAGQLCATVANYAGRMRSEEAGAASPGDFMPSLYVEKSKAGPVLIDDVEAQSRLIMTAVFKKES